MRWSYMCSKFLNARGVAFNSYFFLSILFETIKNPTRYALSERRCHCVSRFEKLRRGPKLLGFIDNLEDKVAAETLHAGLVKNATVVELNVGNYMLSIYVKFKHLVAAQKMFDEMPARDVKSWTIMISGFARMGSFRLALDLFSQMLAEGVCPNQFTLSSVLKCCSSVVQTGRSVHGWLLRNGVVIDAVLKNSILEFYVTCGELNHAERLFVFMGDRDTVSCNIMISGYIQSGDWEKSLDMFRRLPSKDVATWNTVIYGLMQNGFQRKALELLYEMLNIRACFSAYTFCIALFMASSLSNVKLGRQMHAQLIRVGLHNNDFIRSSLIDMYSKCGKIDNASIIFKRKQNSDFNYDSTMEDTVSRSSIISGYVRNGRWEDALQLFFNMISKGIKVDKFTITSIISACVDCEMLNLGQQIHALVLKSGHKLDMLLCSSLIDMYSKCGSLSDAHLLFNQINDRNVILFTSIISGCALHGQGKDAIFLFELMRNEGIQPNEVTFVGLLTACSHSGLVDEGCRYFRLMKEVYGITPGVEHFTCMVDLFGRAGRLYEVKQFIDDNGVSHLSSVWRAFLSCCQVHKNVEMGNQVAEKLLEIDPSDAEPYVLLSNMCASGDRWEESARLRNLMRRKGVKKQPGQSWIRLNNRLHTNLMIMGSNHENYQPCMIETRLKRCS
ncbi:hypothetical protein Nepgr_012200 [Nepenthes gracilis]|uniref:Pentatricopeptide repeat-containing protein n=1 Tax=Nepenthes gracilis TaxID=150966 RepID=A0AAD3SGK6_NEPGR|nr:hypothetical protein Nepgr_012200 [Nepenthes gracilis]